MFDVGYGTACLDMLARVSAHWPIEWWHWRSVFWHGMSYSNVTIDASVATPTMREMCERRDASHAWLVMRHATSTMRQVCVRVCAPLLHGTPKSPVLRRKSTHKHACLMPRKYTKNACLTSKNDHQLTALSTRKPQTRPFCAEKAPQTHQFNAANTPERHCKSVRFASQKRPQTRQVHERRPIKQAKIAFN